MADKTIKYNLHVEADLGSIKDMRENIKALTAQMSEAGKVGNKALYDQIGGKIGALKNDISDLNQKMKFSDSGEALNGIVKLSQGIAGSFAAASAGFQLLAGDNKKMQQILGKTAQVIQLLQGLEQARALIEGKGLIQGLALQAKNLAMKAGLITATVAQGAATSGAIAPQIALNAAMMANPAGIIMTAIIALGAAVTALILCYDDGTKSVEAYTTATNYMGQQTPEQTKKLNDLRDSIRDLNLEYRKLTKDISEEEYKRLKNANSYSDKIFDVEYTRSLHRNQAIIKYEREKTELENKKLINDGDRIESLDRLYLRHIETLARIDKEYSDEKTLIVEENKKKVVVMNQEEINTEKEKNEKLAKENKTANKKIQDESKKDAADFQKWLDEMAQKDIDDEKKRQQDILAVIADRYERQLKLTYEKEQKEDEVRTDVLEKIRVQNLSASEIEIKDVNDKYDTLEKLFVNDTEVLKYLKKQRNKDLFALENDLHSQKQQIANEEIDAAQQLGNTLVDIANSAYSQQISSINKKYDEQIKATQNAGRVLTAEEQAVVALEQKKADEIEIINRKSNQLKKTAAIANIGIDLAQQIMAIQLAVANIASSIVGIPASLVYEGLMTGLAIATAGAQIALVNKQFAKGGILEGNSHSNGGIKTPFGELEGGEHVSSKKTTTRFAPILTAMNNAGNNNSQVDIINYDRLASVLAEKINDKKVILVASEVSYQQRQDTKIENRAKF